MKFIPPDEVEWVSTKILKSSDAGPVEDHVWEHEFLLPRPLADWDVFSYWEQTRFHHMRDNLKPGMVLFDVGTEQGWCNLLYASYVGPENMVLIEPTPEFWPNIKATWERNYDTPPRACYDGLFGPETDDERTEFTRWPTGVDGPLIDRNRYQYLHEHDNHVRQLRLDDFVERTGIIPDAITMDVEGAELRVLQGASTTLRKHHPPVWVSVHPDLGLRDYGVRPAQVHSFMANLGYSTRKKLAVDHEQHFFYGTRR